MYYVSPGALSSAFGWGPVEEKCAIRKDFNVHSTGQDDLGIDTRTSTVTWSIKPTQKKSPTNLSKSLGYQIDLPRTERKHTCVSLVYFKIKRVPSFLALPVSFTSLTVPLCLRYDMQQISKLFRGTVEPVLSGTVLPGYPVLSGRLSKSRNSFPL